MNIDQFVEIVNYEVGIEAELRTIRHALLRAETCACELADVLKGVYKQDAKDDPESPARKG